MDSFRKYAHGAKKYVKDTVKQTVQYYTSGTASQVGSLSGDAQDKSREVQPSQGKPKASQTQSILDKAISPAQEKAENKTFTVSKRIEIKTLEELDTFLKWLLSSETNPGEKDLSQYTFVCKGSCEDLDKFLQLLPAEIQHLELENNSPKNLEALNRFTKLTSLKIEADINPKRPDELDIGSLTNFQCKYINADLDLSYCPNLAEVRIVTVKAGATLTMPSTDKLKHFTCAYTTKGSAIELHDCPNLETLEVSTGTHEGIINVDPSKFHLLPKKEEQE